MKKNTNTTATIDFASIKLTDGTSLKDKGLVKSIDMNCHKRFDNIVIDTELPPFDALVMALKDRNGVTTTNKNVRIYVSKNNFLMCWRRASYIRVYTCTPELFTNIDWVAYENPNEKFTHYAHVQPEDIINAIS